MRGLFTEGRYNRVETLHATSTWKPVFSSKTFSVLPNKYIFFSLNSLTSNKKLALCETLLHCGNNF